MSNINVAPLIRGEYKDTIKYKDGTVEVYEDHNLIVDGIFNLITSLLATKSEYKGLQYWAIGEGLSSWNSEALPQPTAKDTKLVKEIGRKLLSPSNISWVNDRGEPSESPTNRLKVSVTFGHDECTGNWREFGLFGGNATVSADSGILINHKNHGLIVKTTEMEISREIIFTFTKAE